MSTKDKSTRNDKWAYQGNIVKILKEMEKKQGNFSTIVVIPTGGGKTVIGLKYLDEHAISKGDKVLWLTHTKLLLTQAAERMLDSKFEFNNLAKAKYQVVSGSENINNNKDFKMCKVKDIKKDTDILFATVDSLAGILGDTDEKQFSKFKAWISDINKSEKRLHIIYDEAHHIGGETIRNFLEVLLCKPSLVKKYALIGMTATVHRENDNEIAEFYAWFKDGYDNGNGDRYEGGKLVHNASELKEYGEQDENGKYGFNNRIDFVPIKGLIEKGILTAPNFVRVDDFEYEEHIPKGKDQVNYLLGKLSDYDYKTWGKTILFVETIEIAKELQKRLSNSVVYTSKSEDDPYYRGIKNKSSISDMIRKDFEDENSGKDIMITVSLVSEGYDFKKLRTIYLSNPTNSKIRLRQRIGRVLRRDEDNETNVIWTCYPYDRQLLGRPATNSSEAIDIKRVETPDDIEREEEENSKRKYLMAPSYINPLKQQHVSFKNTVLYYELLNILSLFDVADLGKYIGYYNLDEVIIHLDASLMEGFEQFYRQIRTDCQVANKTFDDLVDYIKYLFGSTGDENRKEFIRKVKEDCFYKSNIKISDTNIKSKKKIRFFISDNGIENFFNWVMRHDICMPSIQKESGLIIKEGLLYLRNQEFNNDNEKSSIEKELSEWVVNEILKKIEDEYKDKAITLLDILDALPSNMEGNAAKISSDLLSAYGYGECDNIIAEEMNSFRSLLSVGFCSEDRYQYKCAKDGKEKDLAYMYLDDGKFVGGKRFSARLSKNSKNFLKYDNLQIARCLVKTIYHISVSREDVKDYSNRLIEALLSKNITFDDEETKDKVVGEFLMALGYEGNSAEKLISTQCQLFGKNVPNILKYVIYDKVYDKLVKIVDYTDNGIISSICQNCEDLRVGLVSELANFGITDASFLDPLTPLEDVIYDYRPYLKAIPHYQGIKPEFLCRMTNFLVQQVKDVATYVDAFGGSGANTLNFYMNGDKKVKQVYNEYGVSNTAFYLVLQDDDKFTRFNNKIQKFINIVKNREDDLEFMNSYFKYSEKIVEVLEKEVITKKASEMKTKIEEVLKKKASVIAEEYTDMENGRKAEREEKLKNYFHKYSQFLSEEDEKEEDKFVNKYIGIENVLYGIRNKCGIVYHYVLDANMKYNLSDVDLAFLFFIYHSFSDRQKFDSCTINRFAEFCSKHENWLKNGRRAIKEVTIYNGDANKLLNEEENTNNPKASYLYSEKTVWYCDIPYSETDGSDYVAGIFDIANFINQLAKLKGYYIVSSRYNVCCQKDFKQLFWGMGSMEVKDYEVDIKDINGKKFLMRRANILAFYNQFTNTENNNLKQIIDSIKVDERFKDIENKKLITSLEKYANIQIANSHNKAKYVIIPFTCVEEKAKDDTENLLKGNGLYKNTVSMSEKSFERMMQNTAYSNIPVEVMITNIDIKEEVLADRKVGDGIWAIPTFKTGMDGSNYHVEPIVMVIQYDRYLELEYKCLFKEQYMKQKDNNITKSSVAFFQSYFSMKK